MNTSKYFFQSLAVVVVSTLSFLVFKTFLPKEYGDPSSLVTGDVTVVPYSANSTDARILIRQIDPLPITVLNIMAKVEIIGDYSN